MRKRICMVLKRNLKMLEKDSRVLREARTLMDAGYDVSVAIYGDGQSRKTLKLDGIHVIVAKVKDLFVAPMCNPFNDLGLPRLRFPLNILCTILARAYEISYLISTTRLLLKVNADAYHAHDAETLLPAYVASSLKGSRLVYDSHELWVERRRIRRLHFVEKPLYRLFYRIVEGLGIRRADAVYTVNESLAEHLTRSYRIEMPVVLRNCPEHSMYEGETEAIKKALSLGQSKRIVIYQGLLMSGRGLENLVDSARHLADDAVLVLMGWGQDKEALTKRIRESGLDDRVKMLDAVPPKELIRYTSSADLGVIPYENLCLNNYLSTPNKVWEYIASGIPFAASDFPQMRKLAVDEDMGEVFDPEDPRSIADALSRLLGDREIYERKKGNVLRLAKERYNWESEGKKLLMAYESMFPEGKK